MALVLTGVAACEASNPAKPIEFKADGYEGFEDGTIPLVAAACDTTNGIKVTLAAGETGYIFRRVSDNYIVANATTNGQSNGPECSMPATSLTTANAKKIEFVSSSPGTSVNNQKVIIDFSNGLFGVSTTASTFTGNTPDSTLIQIDLGNGTGHVVKFRGTAANDYFVLGTAAGTAYSYLAATSSATAVPALPTIQAVSIKRTQSILLSAGLGNDIITGQGLGATVTAAANALDGTINLTLYGGEGDDIITSGGFSAASPGTNLLYGGAGNDRFVQQFSCAKDSIEGDAGIDTVDYSSRTAGVQVTIGTPLNAAAVAATGTITCVPSASLVNNDSFTLDDGTHGSHTTFEYKVHGNTAASGDITVGDNTAMHEGDYFTLSDGNVLHDKTFYFDKGGLGAKVDPDYAIVVGADADGTVTNMVTAIAAAKAAGTSLGITASNATGGVLHLVNDVTGPAGDYTIDLSHVAGGLTTTDMTGGVTWTATGAPVVVIDVTAGGDADFVCGQTKTMINGIGATLTIHADDPVAGVMALTNTVAGVAGNVVNTSNENVAAPGFHLSDMAGGAATISNFVANDGQISCAWTSGGNPAPGVEGDDIQSDVENVYGGSGADTIDARLATGTVHILLGLAGADTIYGADGAASFIYGGAGDDLIVGGTALDTLIGGDGNDTLQPGTTVNDVVDGSGVNCPLATTPVNSFTVVISNNTTTTCPAATGTWADTLSFADRDGSHAVQCDLSGLVITTQCGDNGQKVAWSHIANLKGGAGGDHLYGDDNDNTIWGGAGNDIINGNGGNDTLYGEAGNDVIHGNAGNDTIVGGPGADSLYGDAGKDLLDAQDGEADTVVSCGGDDGDIGVIDAAGDPAKLGCQL